MMNFKDFIMWEKASQDTVDVKLIYIDLVDDLVTGVLLSQIVYWYLPNKSGESKLRVQKEGNYWIAKKREDWWNEIRISPKQFDRASDLLVSKGIIEKKKFKFAGDPVVHIRLIFPIFLELLESVANSNVQKSADEGYENMTEHIENTLFNQKVNSKLTKGEVENTFKDSKEITEEASSYTENTPENYTESTSIHQADNRYVCCLTESKSNDNGWIDNNTRIIDQIFINCGFNEMDNYSEYIDGEGKEFIKPIKRAIIDMVKSRTTTIAMKNGGSKERLELSRDAVITQLLKLNISAVKMTIEAMVEYQSITPIKNSIEFAKTTLFNEIDQWECRMQQKIDFALQQYTLEKQ